MDNKRYKEYKCSRITCVIHSKLSEIIMKALFSYGIERIFVENALCIRQRVLSRMFNLPGTKIEINDSPAEVIRVTVPENSKNDILNSIIEAADLKIPGRGSVYAQDVTEISLEEPAQYPKVSDPSGTILRDLSFINAIVSIKGDSVKLANLSLKLGGGVPVVTRGVGTSIRDRLGLIRITIPPEKELVHLVVAAHDAPVLERLLIEEGHIDRPGGGFIYRTPVYGGVLDSMTSIGRQEKAASIEQIIAALDDLKKGTSWRKRFIGEEYGIDSRVSKASHFSEISFLSPEDSSDLILKAVTEGGASGVTTSYLRCISSGENETVDTVRVRGILCVPKADEKKMTEIITEVSETCGLPVRIQIVPAFGVFSHNRYT